MARTKSEFLNAFGTAFEVFKKIVDAVRAEGGNDDHIRRLLERDSPLPREIAKLLVANSKSSPYKFDKTKDGWKLDEPDVGFNPAINSMSDLRLVAFLQGKETYVGGEEMVRRARCDLRANLGQLHAEWVLENQKDIPEDWRKYVLVFPGTVWRDSGGDRYVPYLYWRGGEWYLYFDWLDRNFYAYCRVMRLGE